MLSSSEVLLVLLKAMGAAVGVAVVVLAVFLITRDAGTRKALVKALEGIWVLAYFVAGVVTEYAKAFGLFRFNHLLKRERFRKAS